MLAQIGACALLALLVIISATATVSAPQMTLATATPSHQSSPSRTPSPRATATSTRARPTPTSVARRIAPQSVHGQPQVDEHTVALYHFDAPDTVAIDATGRYTGTLVGNAVIGVPLLYDGVLSLDGNGSYVRTGYLGDLSEGTIEAFVDFSTACATSWDFTIISASGEPGSNQPALVLRQQTGLMFGIYVEGQWRWADSGINACRYLNTGHSSNPPPWENVPVLWPYETWRFHHVAGTWGPRGMEIWVDGVLHGLGNTDPNAGYYPYPWMCNPQEQEMSVSYPNCDSPNMAPPFPPGDYTGGLPSYSTFLIGCDSAGSCFKGRIDEVRISNVQRTFQWSVVPTITPTPTQTPVPISGEYAVDANTAALFHLNLQSGSAVYDEVSQQYKGLMGQAFITPNGRFNGGLFLDGNGSGVNMGTIGYLSKGTAEAWVCFTDSSAGQRIIAALQPPTSGPTPLFLGVSDQGSIGLGIYDAYTFRWVDSGVMIGNIVGSWHHVAGTWGARGAEIWIDGSLRGADRAYAGELSGLYFWRAGCDNVGYCLKGILDEVRVSLGQRTFTVNSLLGSTRSGSVSTRSPANRNFFLFLPFINVVPTSQAVPCR